MKEKKSFSRVVEKIAGGKGFYIVLFACIAVIGVSAWVMLLSPEKSAPVSDKDYTPTMANVWERTGEEVFTNADEDDTILPAVNDENVLREEKPTPMPDHKDDAQVTPEKTEEKKTDLPVLPSSEIKTASAPQAEAEPEEHITAGTLAFIWPVAGDIEMGYSPDSLIYNRTMDDWRTHSGVDIAAAMGAKVMATADGMVVSVMNDDMYGTVVRIDHGDGLMSVYANLAGTPTVNEGDAVTMGSVIGSVGDTALAEKGEVTHLHFAMELNAEPADPADYLPAK